MSFLLGPLDELVRSVHIGGAVLWVGLLHFMAFIRPSVVAGLGEGTAKEVVPNLSARMVPWLSWGALVTVLAGLVLYFDVVIRRSFADVSWATHLGSLLGLVMLGLLHAAVLPGLRASAGLLAGSPPPPEGLLKRAHMASRWSAVLSWVVLLLMVWGAH